MANMLFKREENTVKSSNSIKKANGLALFFLTSVLTNIFLTIYVTYEIEEELDFLSLGYRN